MSMSCSVLDDEVDVYFFFQAEDGIRDYKVTGVQTCALPIYLVLQVAQIGLPAVGQDGRAGNAARVRQPVTVQHDVASQRGRSEERRVGKECRSRWLRFH